MARLADRGALQALALSPDDRLAVTVSMDGPVIRWDAVEAKEQARWPYAHQPRAARTRGTMLFSPDGRWLAFVATEDHVMLVAVRSGLVSPLPTSEPVTELAFSHDGQRLAIAGGSRAAVWSIEPLRPISAGPAAAPIGSIAVSPDGRSLVAGAGEQLLVWSEAGRDPIFERQLESAVLEVAFGGNHLVAAASTRYTVYDLTSGARLLEAHPDSARTISALGFTPELDAVVAEAGGGGLRTWNLRSGEEVMRMSLGGVGSRAVCTSAGDLVAGT